MDGVKSVHQCFLTERGILKPVRKYFHTHREEIHAASQALRIPSGGSRSKAFATSTGLQGLPKGWMEEVCCRLHLALRLEFGQYIYSLYRIA